MTYDYAAAAQRAKARNALWRAKVRQQQRDKVALEARIQREFAEAQAEYDRKVAAGEAV
jgi:hypothetical protein